MIAASSEPTYVRQQRRSKTADLEDYKCHRSRRILGRNHGQRTTTLRCGAPTLAEATTYLYNGILQAAYLSDVLLLQHSSERDLVLPNQVSVLLCSAYHVFSVCSPAAYVDHRSYRTRAMSHPPVRGVSHALGIALPKPHVSNCLVNSV